MSATRAQAALACGTAELVARYRPKCLEARNREFALKLAVFAVVLAGGVFLTLMAALWARVAGTLIVGVMFAHGLELQHETLHNIGFRGRRGNVVAGVLLGAPMLVSYAAYQASHLRHHRDLGTPANQEFFDYGDQYGATQLSRPRRAWQWLYRLSIVAHYRQFLINLGRVIAGRPIPGERPATKRRIRRDYLIILGLLAGAAAVSGLTRPSAIVWAWLVPLLIVAGPAHALIELPEHFRCNTDTTDVLENSRTIRSNSLMMWLTNTNNLHVEHHLMPNLPFSYLSELHYEIADKARFFERSYYAFFRSLLRAKTSGI